MIAAFLLISGAVAAAPVAPLPSPSPNEILAGAEYAISANRLDQASAMISRAVAAGATGSKLDRAVADLDFASGKYGEALGHYQALLTTGPADEPLLEHAGIAALKLGDGSRAFPWLERATAQATATWRAWNALGVAADLEGDWTKAEGAFDKAAALAPGQSAPVNNRGWSLLLRGEWREALGYFQRAAAMDPKSKRVANNLELASTALAADLPARRPGESDSSWAARLNDAGVAAVLLGQKGRAIAAFTQALDASGIWYQRAANNLEAVAHQ
jgi:Flp pilus assembly protein TadD